MFNPNDDLVRSIPYTFLIGFKHNKWTKLKNAGMTKLKKTWKKQIHIPSLE